MKLQPNKKYIVAQKICVRGNPCPTKAIVIRGGYFVRETPKLLEFRGFKMWKNTIVHISEATDESESIVAFYNQMLNAV